MSLPPPHTCNTTLRTPTIHEAALDTLQHIIDGTPVDAPGNDWRGLAFHHDDEDRVHVVCAHGTYVIEDVLGDMHRESVCNRCESACCDRCAKHLPCSKHDEWDDES